MDLFYPHFNGGQAIFYASGFGAINAVTAAFSGLSIVKAHNLQHIFWVVVGLYMLTATVAVVARRPLAAVQFLPVLFLSAYPLHNLPPDLHWTHGAQQSAPPLLIAIPILSLLLPARRYAFYTGMAIQAALSLLVLALSPVCAPFLLLACTAALLINCYRARVVLGERILKVASIQAAAHGASRAPDPRLRPLLQQVDPEPTRSQLYDGIALRRQRGSWSEPSFLFLAQAGSYGHRRRQSLRPHSLADGESHLPGRHLAWLVLALTACACVLAGRGRTAPLPARSLAVVAAASLIGWLAAKYGMTFFAGGITKPTQDASLLYALSLLPRSPRGVVASVSRGPDRRCERLSQSSRRSRACHRQSNDRRGRDHPGSVVASPRAHASGSTPESPRCPEPRGLRKDHARRYRAGVVDGTQFAARQGTHRAYFTRLQDPGLPSCSSRSALHKRCPFTARDTTLLSRSTIPAGRTATMSTLSMSMNFLDVGWCLENNIRYFHVPKGRSVSQSWIVAGTGNWLAAASSGDSFLWCLRGSSPALDSSPAVDSDHPR